MKKKIKKSNRTIELTASVSAVIPTGNYENFKPLYSVKEIFTANNKKVDEVISKRTDELRSLLNSKLQDDYDKMRIERIKLQRVDIRFYQRGDRQYPSVTSIISAVEPINFDPVKLKQYGSRGSLVHKQIGHFFQTGGTWENNVLKIMGTKLDYLVVTQGDLKLKWDDCNFPAFWQKFGKDFAPVSESFKLDNEITLFNDEYLYAGTLDLRCKYLDKKTLADFKTASDYDNDKLDRYFRQLAAYAVMEKDVEQMMIIPLNPSNKTGFGAPIIETDIQGYFQKFLQDRAAFKEIYGI